MSNGIQLERASKRKISKKKWIVWGLVSLFSIWIVASIGIAVKVGMELTHKPRKPITVNPGQYGLQYEDISFLSKDGGLTLKGWVIEPKQPAKMTVIFSHGYNGNRFDEKARFLPLSAHFAERGYRVIMFDFRSNGESEGEMTTVSAKEQYDLLGAIDWAKEQYPNEPISLYGVSMGASTSLLAAGASPDVLGVVADSPFSDLRSYLEENLPVWTKLPDFPYTPLIIAIIPLITDLNPEEASPIRSMDNIYPRPVLFIHGDGDKYIPYSESVRMQGTHPDAFQLWVPKGANHVKGFIDYPEEYVERVLSFYDGLLK